MCSDIDNKETAGESPQSCLIANFMGLQVHQAPLSMTYGITVLAAIFLRDLLTRDELRSPALAARMLNPKLPGHQL